MPRYFEFAADPSDPGLLGNAVYSGVPETRGEFDGLRVNGEELTFLDGDTVDTLHRALVDGQRFVARNGRGFDCVTFALLMSGVELNQLVRRKDFDVQSDTDDEIEVVDDTRQDFPLAIGAWPRMYDAPFYFHTIVPAHTADSPLYLHKLGDEGPVCISSMGESQRIVRGSLVSRVPAMTVRVKNRVVAEWKHVKI